MNKHLQSVLVISFLLLAPALAQASDSFVKCTVSFKNNFGTDFIATSEAGDVTNALSNLNESCNGVPGVSPDNQEPNSHACQSNLYKAVCINTLSEAQYFYSPNGFYSFKMPFQNHFGTNLSVNGSGSSATAALLALWQACDSVPGVSPDNQTPNAKACNAAFTARRYQSTVSWVR